MNKLFFFIKRPPIILVVGKDRASAKEAILQLLKPGVLIFESDLSEPKEFKKFSFFLRKSKLPILVTEDMKNKGGVRELVKILPARGFLVLNFDDEAVRELKKESLASSLTYGFQEGADLKATDINVSPEGTNFKVDYQGKIVPFWLKNISEKEQIYSYLAAISVAVVKDLNLVEISQALRK